MLAMTPDNPSAPDRSSPPGKVGIAIELRSLSLWYAQRQVLDAVSFDVPAKKITAVIGPSACGKSSLLRCINRLNDEIVDCRVTGEVRVGGLDIYAKDLVVHELRRRVGMVFQ